MMNKVVYLAFLSCLAASHPTDDLRYVNCDPEIEKIWPEDLTDDQILHPSNAKPDMSGPFFRIYSQVDMRRIVGEKTYLFEISRLTEETRFQRFLISIESANPDGSVMEDIGELKSLSDFSEHLSYRCPRYLVERSTDISLEVTVPFAWKAPKEGCVEVSALVLDTYFGFYSKDNDYFSALKIVACVDPTLGHHEAENKVGNANEVASPTESPNEDSLDDNTQVDTIIVNPDLEESAKKVDNLDEPVDVDNNVIPEEPKVDDDNESKDQDDDEDDLGEVLPVAAALIADVKDDKKMEVTDDKKERKGLKQSKKQKTGGMKEKRRKGKKLCCQNGYDSKDSACANISDTLLAEAQDALGLKNQKCIKMFKSCCKNKQVGAKKLKRLDKSESGSSLGQKSGDKSQDKP